MDLIEMYPAAVNSKVTVTLGVLNADSTIIEVLDGSVLPDAPTLLVLGSDQTAETVKLTAKEGNTLTVERGIQGNAIAWPAGTQIARNFTAKDWNDLIANVAIIVAKIMGLTAADVHARPDTWMPTASDVGARPNANLLHNWYFGNPVNRNGLTEYAGNMLGIDRWRSTNANLTVTVNDGFLNLSATTAGHGYFRQPNNRALSGVLTFSALVKGDGAVQFNITESNLVTALGSRDCTVSSDTWTLIEYTIDIENNASYNSELEYTSPYVRVNSGVNIDILAIKLEYGDTQTLAHQDENGVWVLNEIPDYAEQMAICEQYNLTTGAYIGSDRFYGEHNKELLSGEVLVLPLADGLTKGDGSSIYFKDADGTVTVLVSAEGSSIANGQVVATLPAGYLPTNWVTTNGAVTTSSQGRAVCVFSVGASGTIKVYHSETSVVLVIGTIVFKAAN